MTSNPQKLWKPASRCVLKSSSILIMEFKPIINNYATLHPKENNLSTTIKNPETQKFHQLWKLFRIVFAKSLKKRNPCQKLYIMD